MMTKRLYTQLAMALLAANAAAQTTEPEPTMQRVEITGSLIRRIASETALPLTSIRAEDFAR
jgi:iron complex outermembrane receptor protein